MIEVEQFAGLTLILGDCRALKPCPEHVLLTDPPYGMNYRVNARKWSNAGLKTDKTMAMAARPPIAGDTAPFDPSHLLCHPRAAIFGANKMAGLPPGGRWIVWDKRRDSEPDDHSDCELVWTSVPGADRIHRQKWRGIVREGEENLARKGRKLHSNQKPVALLDRLLEELGAAPGDVIYDPYMGSGSTAVAALRRGLGFIGVEIERPVWRTAVERLRAEAAQ